MPTAVPTMPASASGLSTTRVAPNLRWRSSVTRNTPPSTPTSSPMTSTSGSRSISWSSARFRAFTMFSFAMVVSGRAWAGSGVRGTAAPRRRTAGRRPTAPGRGAPPSPRAPRPARAAAPRRRDRTSRADRPGERLEGLHRAGDLRVDALVEVGVQQVALLEVRAEAGEGVLALPRLHLFGRPVLRGVVRGRVHAQAIGDALDEGGPVAGARPVHRLPARHVDREDVVAVELDPGEAVGEGLLGDGARVGLLLEGHRDGPLVVLDHEHQRQVPDPREVH